MKIRDKILQTENTIRPESVYIPPQATEEELPPIDKEQQDLIDLHELLAEVDKENAPMVSTLEAWKSRHKSLYVSKISMESDKYYVFTTIKRHEFKKLQEQGIFDNEEKGNEVLVEKCLLYPMPTQSWRLTSDAGIITTLGKQIAYKSGFVSPQEALSLIKIV